MTLERELTARKALVAIGSNLAVGGTSPPDLVGNAINRLSLLPGGVTARSRIYRTPAIPENSGPDYANAAVQFGWWDTAESLLALLHGIEADAGRRRGARWGPRTLDLDLIALGDMVAPDEDTWREWRNLPPEELAIQAPDRLVLPHPRLQDRAFVLVPLADIAPDWRHPVTGLSVLRMLELLPPGQASDARPVDSNSLPKAPGGTIWPAGSTAPGDDTWHA